jgi:hypothetical protein
MAVCATCLRPDIRTGEHDCPGYGDIQLTRVLGRGLIVDTAPGPLPHGPPPSSPTGDWGASLQGTDLHQHRRIKSCTG